MRMSEETHTHAFACICENRPCIEPGNIYALTQEDQIHSQTNTLTLPVPGLGNEYTDTNMGLEQAPVKRPDGRPKKGSEVKKTVTEIGRDAEFRYNLRNRNKADIKQRNENKTKCSQDKESIPEPSETSDDRIELHEPERLFEEELTIS